MTFDQFYALVKALTNPLLQPVFVIGATGAFWLLTMGGLLAVRWLGKKWIWSYLIIAIVAAIVGGILASYALHALSVFMDTPLGPPLQLDRGLIG